MKRLSALIIAVLLICSVLLPANAASYTSYTYNSKSKAVKTPMAYTATAQLSGKSLGVGDLKEAADIYTDYNGFIYICDSGNNRIIKLNSDMTLNMVITEFIDGYFKGEFSNPNGVFVDKNTGILYVADTDNARVIGLNENLEMVRRFDRPNQKELFAEDQVFAPTKVVVDNGGRAYIISKDVYEGLMQYDSDGNFLGYVGANEVSISPLDYIWKKISTKAQSSKMQLTLPTEFSNCEIDSEGFIYTTTSIINTQNTDILVRRQNPSGDDVLHKNENLLMAGDIDYDEYSSDYTASASNFVDITVNGDGMYSLLDSKRGRIFTYDFEGNLLYVFGGTGNNGSDLGTFYTPVSMARNGDKFLVLDISSGMLTVFEPTQYAVLINTAVAESYNGKYDAASENWKKVLKLNSNYEQAYVGIGIAQLRNKEYKEAMESFKLGQNRTYYSKAFKNYRQIWLENNFIWIVAFLVIAFVALCALHIRNEKHSFERRNRKIEGKFKFALYSVTHPFDGFYVMKREKRGSLALSGGILAFTVLGFVISKQLTGFIINTNDPNEFNLIDEIVKVVAVFSLYCIINWCVTALMDGEGKLTDIICCTATGLIPLAVSLIPLTALSNVLTADDMAFYNVLMTAAILYTAFLIIVGVMETHQYSLGKTIFVLVITLLGMVVAVFLFMLFVNLINTMYDFFVKLFNEVTVR